MESTGVPPISQTDGHAYGDSLTMWNPVLWSYGAKEVNADGKTVAINSAETRNAIKWAQGAVKAALWARQRKPGLYSMADVLGLSDF